MDEVTEISEKRSFISGLFGKKGDSNSISDILNRAKTYFDSFDVDYGLAKDEQSIIRKYAERNYGLLPNQEDFMVIVQDPQIGGMNLLWADKLRKSIA